MKPLQLFLTTLIISSSIQAQEKFAYSYPELYIGKTLSLRSEIIQC